LSVSYSIYKSEDNSVIDSGSLSNPGNGMYTGSYLCDTLGQYYIIYTTPSGYTDELESIMVSSETAKADVLARILGANGVGEVLLAISVVKVSTQISKFGIFSDGSLYPPSTDGLPSRIRVPHDVRYPERPK